MALTFAATGECRGDEAMVEEIGIGNAGDEWTGDTGTVSCWSREEKTQVNDIKVGGTVSCLCWEERTVVNDIKVGGVAGFKKNHHYK